MRKQDSLLYLMQQWGQDRRHPQLFQRLLLEDIPMPNLRHTIAMGDILRHVDLDDESILHKPEPEPPASGIAQKIRRRVEEYMIGYMKNSVPKVMRERYDGLSDYEAGHVFLYNEAPAARFAGPDCHPDIDAMIKDMTARAGLPAQHVIIMDSDFPEISSLTLPGQPPALLITSYMAENLTMPEMEAVIGHELLHAKKHDGKGIYSSIWDIALEILTLNEVSIREEYKADQNLLKLGASADDMVSALTKVQLRYFELKDFAVKLNEALEAEGLDANDVFPPNFITVTSLKDSKFRVMPEKSWAEYFKKNLDDAHPPMVSRFDRLFEAEDKQQGVKRS